jgi:hypothetical protein
LSTGSSVIDTDHSLAGVAVVKLKSDTEILHTDEEECLELDPRWELTQKIVRHSTFSRATQLRNILLYIVRQAILRPAQSVEDSEIAQRVLGRRSDYDPMDDSIVRVQMAHLRKRLSQYFSNDGKDEEVVISIALGSYKPIFSQRPKANFSELPISKDDNHSEGRAPEPGDVQFTTPTPLISLPAKGWRKGVLLWSTGACVMALIVGILVRLHSRPAESGDQKSAEISNALLHQVFVPGATVNVVIADTSLVTLQNSVHSDISVAEYLDPSYPDNVLASTSDPVLRSLLRSLTVSRYTSLNDADVVGQCSYWGAILGAKTNIRYARYMHVRDFQQGNFVIVGSRRGNPWVSLFEPSLNFYFEEDPATHVFHFRNRNPKSGESPTYELSLEKGGSHVGYVDIAVLPNLGGTGSVLLLNGFSIEVDEAAANLIFNKDLSSILAHALGHLSSSSKAEILLRVRSIDRSELGWEIVSIRINGS